MNNASPILQLSKSPGACGGDVGPDPTDWEAVRPWRRNTRALMRSRRMAMNRTERAEKTTALLSNLRAAFGLSDPSCIGFYWPFKGEPDMRGFVREQIRHGASAALPVVVEKAAPVEFWRWQPRQPLARGIWDIPIPAEREVVLPTVLLVPLLGFDQQGYRLGYGGGYYDRTLASFRQRPHAIGVGFEVGRLDSIHPFPHDIPMDAIVTEDGIFRR